MPEGRVDRDLMMDWRFAMRGDEARDDDDELLTAVDESCRRSSWASIRRTWLWFECLAWHAEVLSVYSHSITKDMLPGAGASFHFL